MDRISIRVGVPISESPFYILIQPRVHSLVGLAEAGICEMEHCMWFSLAGSRKKNLIFIGRRYIRTQFGGCISVPGGDAAPCPRTSPTLFSRVLGEAAQARYMPWTEAVLLQVPWTNCVTRPVAMFLTVAVMCHWWATCRLPGRSSRLSTAPSNSPSARTATLPAGFWLRFVASEHLSTHSALARGI